MLTVGLFQSYIESRLCQRDMHFCKEQIIAQKYTNQDRRSRLEAVPQSKYQFLTSYYSSKMTPTQKVIWFNSLTYIICLGVDLQHEDLVKAVAVNNGAQMKEISLCHLMSLQDPSNLILDR